MWYKLHSKTLDCTCLRLCLPVKFLRVEKVANVNMYMRKKSEAHPQLLKEEITPMVFLLQSFLDFFISIVFFIVFSPFLCSFSFHGQSIFYTFKTSATLSLFQLKECKYKRRSDFYVHFAQEKFFERWTNNQLRDLFDI